MRVRVVLHLGSDFDVLAEQLVSDLGDAAIEGQGQLEELLAVLPARLRRIFRQSAAIAPNVEDLAAIRAALRNAGANVQPLGRATPSAQGEGGGPSVIAVSSMADGSPVVARAGRPLGLSTRRKQLLAGESAVPRFTEYRLAAQLSLAAIADMAFARGREISRATLGNLEAGEVLPRQHHAEAIAAGLGLEVSDVLSLLELEAGHVVEV